MLKKFLNGHSRRISTEEAQLLYRWLSVPRFAATMASAGVVLAFWMLQAVEFDIRPILFILLPGFIAISVAVGGLLMRGIMPVALLHAQLLIDLCAIGFAVFLTGGVRSPFAGLFILVVISASVVSVWSLLIVAAGAGVMYRAMSWAQSVGWLNAENPAWRDNTQSDAVTLAVFGLITALIAFQTNYYLAHIRRKDEEILKIKDEMLFRTVHDLRSPSAVIRFVVEKYKDLAKKKRNKELREDMGFISTALGRMSMLIDDVLKMAQGERPDFVVKAEPVNLATVVRSCALELGPVMASRDVRFVYKPPARLPSVRGDSEKLKEVFNNFFDNAVKYNREGGDISVQHRIEGRRMVTEIADNGIGISEKSQQKLFTPYFRGDIGKEVPGTGLGLYMTKKLVEKMGGEVHVRSTQGVGTTFIVTLPLAKG